LKKVPGNYAAGDGLLTTLSFFLKFLPFSARMKSDDQKAKQAQTMDVFIRLIEDGVTECAQIAQEMSGHRQASSYRVFALACSSCKT
jgi:hypothetical protein